LRLAFADGPRPRPDAVLNEDCTLQGQKNNIKMRKRRWAGSSIVARLSWRPTVAFASG
jgi:hypothetical protein